MKRQVIASFELPKIQAAESQPYPLFIYIFLLQILLPTERRSRYVTLPWQQNFWMTTNR